MGFARSYHKIFWFGHLQHLPHSFNIFGGETPIALSIQISQINFFIKAGFDAGNSSSDFFCDKGGSATRRLEIEEYAVDGKNSIGLSVNSGNVVGKNF